MNKLPDHLNEENVKSMDFFRDDLEELYDDNRKTGELAEKISTDLDTLYFNKANRELMGRGTLPFVSEQVKNLVTLRTAKSNTTNQIIQSKLKLAQLAMNKDKNKEDVSNNAAIAREFQRLFMANRNTIADTPDAQYATMVQKAVNNDQEDQMFESRLTDLKNSGELVYTDNEQAIKYEARGGVKYKFDKANQAFVAIAADTGEILADYPTTLLPNENLEHAILGPNSIKFGIVEYDYL